MFLGWHNIEVDEAPVVLVSALLVLAVLGVVTLTKRDWRAALDRMSLWSNVLAIVGLLALVGVALVDFAFR